MNSWTHISYNGTKISGHKEGNRRCIFKKSLARKYICMSGYAYTDEIVIER